MKDGSLKTKVLEEICRGKTVSGGLISGKLGVSRTAVWKAVNSLRADGYFISGLGGGYVLSPKNTRICGEQFRAAVGENIVFKEESLSTNGDIKKLADEGADEFTVVLSRRQSRGKGRMGRSFYAPEGGLYFSVLLRPKSSAETALKITTAAAVAVAEAIEKVVAYKVKIKWVNDIYIRDKKVCGILTEGSFDAENGQIKYAVLGIGINVATPQNGFPEEIKDKAGALFSSSTPPSLVYCAVLNEFLKKFKEYYADIENMPHLEEYRRRSYLNGKTVKFIKDGKEHTAKVNGIGNKAELIVKEGKREVFLSSGEVQITDYE